jgi:hypothetical protein
MLSRSFQRQAIGGSGAAGRVPPLKAPACVRCGEQTGWRRARAIAATRTTTAHATHSLLTAVCGACCVRVRRSIAASSPCAGIHRSTASRQPPSVAATAAAAVTTDAATATGSSSSDAPPAAVAAPATAAVGDAALQTEQQQKPRQRSPDNSRPIVVMSKPVSKALLRRLEQVCRVCVCLGVASRECIPGTPGARSRAHTFTRKRARLRVCPRPPPPPHPTPHTHTHHRRRRQACAPGSTTPPRHTVRSAASQQRSACWTSQ